MPSDDSNRTSFPVAKDHVDTLPFLSRSTRRCGSTRNSRELATAHSSTPASQPAVPVRARPQLRNQCVSRYLQTSSPRSTTSSRFQADLYLNCPPPGITKARTPPRIGHVCIAHQTKTPNDVSPSIRWLRSICRLIRWSDFETCLQSQKPCFNGISCIPLISLNLLFLS